MGYSTPPSAALRFSRLSSSLRRIPPAARRRYHALRDACNVSAAPPPPAQQQPAGGGAASGASTAATPAGPEAPPPDPVAEYHSYLHQACAAFRSAAGAGPPPVPAVDCSLGGSDGGVARVLDGVPGWLAALNLARTHARCPALSCALPPEAAACLGRRLARRGLHPLVGVSASRVSVCPPPGRSLRYPCGSGSTPSGTPRWPRTSSAASRHVLSPDTHARRVNFPCAHPAAPHTTAPRHPRSPRSQQLKLSRVQRPPFLGPVTVNKVTLPLGGARSRPVSNTLSPPFEQHPEHSNTVEHKQAHSNPLHLPSPAPAGNPPRMTDLRMVSERAHPSADLLAGMRGAMPCFEARCFSSLSIHSYPPCDALWCRSCRAPPPAAARAAAPHPL